MLTKFLEYLQYEKKYSPLTIQSYRRDLLDLQNFLLETESFLELEKTDKKQLRNFIIHLSDKKLSEITINRKISSIRSFFKYLLKVESIQTNPTTQLQNLKSKKKVLIPYTKEEINLLYQNIDKLETEESSVFIKTRNKLMFNIFYQTGIRRIELINIETSKTNLEEKTINIIGKRNKERQIPITDELKENIKEYLRIRELDFKLNSKYLFIDKKGDKLNEKFVYSQINKYLSTVTTKDKRSPHMLRHTFASHLLHNGAEINSIKKILGHTSLAATQVYTHNSIENLKKVFNQFHPLGLKNKRNMKIKAQAVNFKAQDSLLEFLDKKVSRLEQFYDQIIGAKAYMKLENTTDKENKTAEVLLEVPGDDLMVSKTSSSFEESIDLCCEALKKMIIRKKEKE